MQQAIEADASIPVHSCQITVSLKCIENQFSIPCRLHCVETRNTYICMHKNTRSRIKHIGERRFVLRKAFSCGDREGYTFPEPFYLPTDVWLLTYNAVLAYMCCLSNRPAYVCTGTQQLPPKRNNPNRRLI